MSVDYERGQWKTFDRILEYLNTLESRMIDKHKIYGDIMRMRPVKDIKKEAK